jgi:2-polyprenyl-6-methoxyphenol hydroxylase-like FAD-dependent oxidoreductase
MRVIIVGAGLGGLTLAHGLRVAGMDVAVYERSPRTGPQPASYGIHVNGHGNSALHACLPTENWNLYDRIAVPAPNTVRFRDPALTLLTSLDLSLPAEYADPIAHRRAVRRQPLRRALLHGLEDAVSWDRTFTSYAEHADGRVRVELSDGCSAEGDVIVGADGNNSRVRCQRLPHLVRQDLGILNVAGRLPLSHPTVRALPGDMVDGSINNVVPAQPGWLFASTWPASHRDPDGGAPDEDFLVWAYAAARDAYPTDVDALAPGDLQDWVAARVAGWDPRIGAMIAASSPDTVAPVPLRSMSTLPQWQPSNIAALLDGAVTQVSGRANTTLSQNSQALSSVIAAHRNLTIGHQAT